MTGLPTRGERDGRRLARFAVTVLVGAGLAGCGSDPPPPELGADSLIVRGQAFYDAARFDSATVLWELALERARAERDLAGEARLLTSLGLAAWWMGDYDRAGRLQERALALERAHGLDDLLPRTYNALGLLAWDQGRFGEAAELLERTAETAHAAGDAEYFAKALVNRALVQAALGEMAAARQGFTEGIEALHRLGDAAMEGRALVNLAALEVRAGDPLAALEPLARARRLARTEGDRPGEEAAMGQLATVHAALGQHQAGLAVLDSALQLAREHGLRQPEAANLASLGAIYRELGDLRRALRFYDRAQAINADLGLADETAAALRSEAEIQAALGNLDVALEAGREALALHQQIGSRFGELADLLLLAELEERSGDPVAADRYLAEARTLAGALGVRSARVDVALTMARIADRRGDDPAILASLDTVRADLPLAGYAGEWEAESLRARALARRGELEEAAAAGRRAVAIVDRARGDLASGLLRSTLGHSRAATYADLVDVLLRLGLTEDAFDVSDAARERPLPGWAVPNAEVARGDARAPALPGGERLLRRIGALAASVREYEELTGDSAVVAELVDRLRVARLEYEELLTRAPVSPGRPAAMEPGGAGATAVVARLREGEALLQYLVGAERVFVFVATSTGVRALRIPATAPLLATRVRLARRLLADPAAGQPDEVLARLHAELISPVAEGGALDGIDRLVIVPHGVLTYLPFAALRDASTRRRLVDDRTLLYLPAAAALGDAARPWVADDAASDDPAAVFAPLPEALPASRAEAAAVAEALGSETRVHVGGRATEAAVRRALGRGGVVHIASHAALNAANPLFSRIRLADASGRSRDRPDADGRLEVHELLELPIRSPLVFLSGCETSLGSGWNTAFAAGEDYATLERALLRAGAANVVGTLWRVQDESAAAFAARFYRRLRHSDAADALAGAQRDLMADPRYAHPFHWAAYRVAGRGAGVLVNAPRVVEATRPAGAAPVR